ncbi:hypothetical protein GTA51_20450, partial [Desulfovibrio aerotolerans]
GSGENFLESTLRYSKKSGVDISRVQSFDANRDMTCRLAYCVFGTIAYNFIHKNSALKADRFAFTLYPGGGFLLNEALSDEKLRSIFADNRFARVITTQAPTYRYLIENGLCDPGKVSYPRQSRGHARQLTAQSGENWSRLKAATATSI